MTALHRLSVWFHVLVVLTVVVSVLLTRFSAAHDTLLERLTAESGPFENGSAVVLLGIGAVAGSLLIQLRRRRDAVHRGHLVFCAFLVVAALFAILEELSWGQHLLGFETHEVFLRHNRQEETNLHNLLPPELFGFAVNASTYVLLVFLPILLHRFPRRSSSWSVTRFAPSLHCVLMCCFGFSLQAYFRFETSADAAALVLALALLGYVIHAHAPTAQPLLKLHFLAVAVLTVLFMTCYEIFSYENVQYEIREFVFMYAFLFWLVDYGHLLRRGDRADRLLFLGGHERAAQARQAE